MPFSNFLACLKGKTAAVVPIWFMTRCLKGAKVCIIIKQERKKPSFPKVLFNMNSTAIKRAPSDFLWKKFLLFFHIRWILHIKFCCIFFILYKFLLHIWVHLNLKNRHLTLYKILKLLVNWFPVQLLSRWEKNDILKSKFEISKQIK